MDNWSFPEILSLLEGGNYQFQRYCTLVFAVPGNANSISSKQARNDHLYAQKAVQMFKEKLRASVTRVLNEHQSTVLRKPIRKSNNYLGYDDLDEIYKPVKSSQIKIVQVMSPMEFYTKALGKAKGKFSNIDSCFHPYLGHDSEFSSRSMRRMNNCNWSTMDNARKGNSNRSLRSINQLQQTNSKQPHLRGSESFEQNDTKGRAVTKQEQRVNGEYLLPPRPQKFPPSPSPSPSMRGARGDEAQNASLSRLRLASKSDLEGDVLEAHTNNYARPYGQLPEKRPILVGTRSSFPSNKGSFKVQDNNTSTSSINLKGSLDSSLISADAFADISPTTKSEAASAPQTSHDSQHQRFARSNSLPPINGDARQTQNAVGKSSQLAIHSDRRFSVITAFPGVDQRANSGNFEEPKGSGVTTDFAEMTQRKHRESSPKVLSSKQSRNSATSDKCAKNIKRGNLDENNGTVSRSFITEQHSDIRKEAGTTQFIRSPSGLGLPPPDDAFSLISHPITNFVSPPTRVQYNLKDVDQLIQVGTMQANKPMAPASLPPRVAQSNKQLQPHTTPLKQKSDCTQSFREKYRHSSNVSIS